MSYNVIDILLTSTSGTVVLSNPIPKQNLKLISYRIKFDTDAHSQACGYIRVNFPFFRGNLFIKGSTSSNTAYLRDANGLVLLNGNNLAHQQTADSWVPMSDNANSSFLYSIVGEDLTGFESCHLVFSFDSGAIY